MRAGSPRTRTGAGAREAPVDAREHLLDDGERPFVEPRLAHLLGLEETGRDKQDLFAAWRLFFERLADAYPTVLCSRTCNGPTETLLDFVEYLLEWSRSTRSTSSPCTARAAERRPTWGAGHRNFTSLYLEPLSGRQCRSSSTALSRDARDACSRSSIARRASRCTRSRPCGCFSTAAARAGRVVYG